MDQENNNDNTIITNASGVRLKKVKRPVRRVIPENPQMSPQNTGSGFSQPPRNPFSSQPQNQAVSGQNDEFDLDSFLDEPENLPAVNNQIQEYNEPDQPQFIDENSLDYATPQQSFLTGGEAVSRRIAVLAAVGALLFGFIIAKLFFSEQKVVRDGLQGVVINAEVPRGRARCGVAEKTQGCVLYLMNPQRQELNARDFYDLASQLTGRQRFVIETGNMRYSSTKIKPGEIGQFNIPPLQ